MPKLSAGKIIYTLRNTPKTIFMWFGGLTEDQEIPTYNKVKFVVETYSILATPETLAPIVGSECFI
jgi:hypothetical protein